MMEIVRFEIAVLIMLFVLIMSIGLLLYLVWIFLSEYKRDNEHLIKRLVRIETIVDTLLYKGDLPHDRKNNNRKIDRA
ncbi:hypothetical protein [Hugenholtzia roseola]|uniref:hypothetical protein n=1 Tax=Hugenholtzia roseola TaxID=1002 RepID=UPI0004787410|nr:hypothetical protein [Hugenholtzia roseola]